MIEMEYKTSTSNYVVKILEQVRQDPYKSDPVVINGNMLYIITCAVTSVGSHKEQYMY